MLLRVSTNDTSPSTSSMIATSAGAPICSVPSLGARLITLAGLIVAMAITCSSVKPCARNLLMTQVRYGMPGVLPEKHVDVGRDGVGWASLCDRRLGHAEVEAAATVADIEDHAALLGRERRWEQPPVLHDVGEGSGDIGC